MPPSPLSNSIIEQVQHLRHFITNTAPEVTAPSSLVDLSGPLNFTNNFMNSFSFNYNNYGTGRTNEPGFGLSALERISTGLGVPGEMEKRMIKERREQRRRYRTLQQTSRLNRPSAKSRAIMKRTLEIANERV